jgi:MFS family permease
VTVFARYATVLRGHGTAVPLTASIVGRLSLGTTSLALLLLVRDTSGSYAVAGLVSGAYALSFGVLGPALARLADRTGPVPALRITATLHPALLCVVVVAATTDSRCSSCCSPPCSPAPRVPPLGRSCAPCGRAPCAVRRSRRRTPWSPSSSSCASCSGRCSSPS